MGWKEFRCPQDLVVVLKNLAGDTEEDSVTQCVAS